MDSIPIIDGTVKAIQGLSVALTLYLNFGMNLNMFVLLLSVAVGL